ncbi:hypothetical protein J3E72DRAFT_376157 [Bipolaris maydis]|uniref:uncharacterized protein n=1 Tax=Cochliobolus heterostrophus TaxID=5016 RepID=UPI0024D4F322|nr:hypothetical protein J3E73DRAFT_257615 [Bipolaris maydis]KAJ5056555.1 hypothetical protein J3E74DRAFT_293994 [Bipolaris maydis]KAJ6196147.1 hypothetical protein J3E72DRAFT_376157 [Bipolaris maydis]KAJ6270233.1 hypothetical protein PSV08DRAFT_247988 [Bipolaris maydis]KAJ6283858.1 hypothetical protein J3E71DRAFT_238537 [Bipolaris maydis]
MVLNLTSSDPRNAESVALRNKQKAELEKFQKGVEAAKAEFFKDIEKKREELLIKHKHEKRDLVNKEQANRSGTALPKESGDRPRQTPANTSKASPYASTPQERTVKQTISTLIDLCSDDDELVFLEQRKAPTSSSASAHAPILSRDRPKTSKYSTEAPKPRRREDVRPQSPPNAEEQQRTRTTTLNDTNLPKDQTERKKAPLPQGDFEMPDRDGPLPEAAQGNTPESQQHINNVLSLPQNSPSLPLGFTSRARKLTTQGNAFKRPLTPTMRNPLAQHNSKFPGSSQVPISRTHHPDTIPSPSSTSVASQKSDLPLHFAKKGKAKVVDISSGEDDDKDGDKNSDDGLLFDDEEALEEEEEKKRTRGKRAKLMPFVSSIAISGPSHTQKSRFGFQINPQSKLRANHQAASSSETLNSNAYSVSTPAAAPAYPTRKAKLNAIKKIAQISQQSTEFFTEEDVDMLADNSDDSDDESVRAPGRCRIVKATVEDNRSPLPLPSDSSKHKFVNGVIFPTDEQRSDTKPRIKRKESWP